MTGILSVEIVSQSHNPKRQRATGKVTVEKRHNIPEANMKKNKINGIFIQSHSKLLRFINEFLSNISFINNYIIFEYFIGFFEKEKPV